ncbi:alpha/beta hydrolase [Lophiostoma macrostomum CBS 122681]|uniref:Alpha/beta hydrolase n=1 Tax=Lophiostoma macrostomum CBS 122681 TaxID=1314788 RepID=A0A6A6SNB1_9PLEO|nr:alpha/beta hydrolase [Lophiostoma macrostomum CBS 122681]
MPLKLDPEVATLLQQRTIGLQTPNPPPIGDYKARRELHEAALAQNDTQTPAGVTMRDFHVTASDNHSILCRWYTKDQTHSGSSKVKKSAAVLYLHGGGYILGNVSLFDKVCGEYVLHTGIPFLSVEYRLAPEFPYPIPVTDAHTAFLWLHQHAEEMDIHPDRIAVMGDSAGGGLAAALTHYNIQQRGPRIAKQILIYPMLDDRNIEDESLIAPFTTWNKADNETGWTCLLGSRCGMPDLEASAAPARMVDATGLPDLYLDVGDLDLFLAEDMEYATRIGRVGTSVELHIYPGCPHGWEHLAPNANVTKSALCNRWRAIQNIPGVRAIKL